MKIANIWKFKVINDIFVFKLILVIRKLMIDLFINDFIGLEWLLCIFLRLALMFFMLIWKWFICLFIYLVVCLFINLVIDLFIYLFIYLFICLIIYSFIYLHKIGKFQSYYNAMLSMLPKNGMIKRIAKRLKILLT